MEVGVSCPRPFQGSQKDQIRPGQRGFAMLPPCWKANGICPLSELFFVCIAYVLVMLVCACVYRGDMFLCVYVGNRGHWMSLFPGGRFLTEPRICHVLANQTC